MKERKMLKQTLLCFVFTMMICVPGARAQVVGTVSVCDVKAYGAQGDGATDDYAAITAALSTAANTKCSVYFPPGTYMISRQLLPGADVVMVGAGSRSSYLKATGSFPSGVSMIQTTAQSNRVKIQDLGFTAVNGTGTGATFQAIEMVGSVEVVVERCWFDATFWWSVMIRGSSRNCGVINSVSEGTQFSQNVEINDSSYCYVTGSTLKNAYGSGIELYLKTAGELQGNRLVNNLIEGSRLVGILCDGDRFSLINGNTIRNTGLQGMLMRNSELLGTDYPSYAGHVVSNTLINCGGTTENGVVIGPGSKGWTLQGNTVTGSGNSGIWVGGTAQTVSGNTCVENRRHGINVSSGGHTISNNICLDNSTIGAQAGDGIRVEFSDRNTITGNRCTDTRAVKLQGWGVMLYQSSNNLITGNSLSGNLRGPIYENPPNGNNIKTANN